jgi:hypothetical protein
MDTKYFLRALGGLAIGLYFAAILYVGILNARSSHGAQVPPIVDYYVTSISTALASFLGMVLGFRRANVTSGKALAGATPTTRLSWMQTIAAWSYVASLCLALGFWMLDGPLSDQAAPVLQALSKSLIGLFIGALAVYLNVQPPQPYEQS